MISRAVSPPYCSTSLSSYSSEIVHAERKIVLGKKSGLDSIDLKGQELGIAIMPDQRAPILAAIKKVAARKRGLVTDEEFHQIVGGQLTQ